MMENQFIELNDFETVCRICLIKKGYMISMFENSLLPNIIKTYKDLLEECTSVHISNDDSLPKKICLVCIKYLEESYKFKIKFLSTEKLLEEIIAKAQSKITKVESFKQEISHDFENEDNSFDSYSYLELNENNINENISKNKVIIKELIKDDLFEASNAELNGVSQNKVITKEFISVKNELVKESNIELHEHDSKDDNTIQKYKCDDCGVTFQSKVEFYKHQNSVHLKGFKCNFCDKNFKRSHDLFSHSPELVQCKICKQDCGCKTKLKDHVQKEHSTCEICGKICQNRKLYHSHLSIHEDKNLLCTYCGRKFAHTWNYTIHLRRHTGEKPYQCTQCDAKFCHATELKEHTSKHSDEKKFECDICNKPFKSKNSVIRHKRSHTDQNIYSCDICHKQFSRRYIRDHQKIHTGEKKHFCKYCNKGFNRNYKLSMHLLTHTGEKPFTCSKCGKSFIQKYALKCHMKNHSDLLEK